VETFLKRRLIRWEHGFVHISHTHTRQKIKSKIWWGRLVCKWVWVFLYLYDYLLTTITDQISNWFINARRRQLPAIMNGMRAVNARTGNGEAVQGESNSTSEDDREKSDDTESPCDNVFRQPKFDQEERFYWKDNLLKMQEELSKRKMRTQL